MEIKILGSAAAEGIPAMFCNCRVCTHAMKEKGKDIKTRSSVLINNDLLIDFNADTYYHKIAFDLKLENITLLLLTHSHTDHFYPYDLSYRGAFYAKNELSELMILGNEPTYRYFKSTDSFEPFEKKVKDLLTFHVIEPYVTYSYFGYLITALKAKHTNPEQALLYLVTKEDKTFFLCNDTARILQENITYLKEKNIKIDAILIDGTSGAHTIGFDGAHQGLEDVVYTIEKLKEISCLNQNSHVIITHVSHNGGYTHDEYEKAAQHYGFAVAYDGMKIII